MILNDEQRIGWQEANAEWICVLTHYIPSLKLDMYCPQTVGEELKRQLAERDASGLNLLGLVDRIWNTCVVVCTHNDPLCVESHGHGLEFDRTKLSTILDAYVAQKVAEAVLAESLDWFNPEDDCTCANGIMCWQHTRIAANRAKVNAESQ